MQAKRFALTILIVIITALGAFSLVGCGGDEQPAQSQETTASQAAESSASEDSSAADDDEQDNCYGDDLPAVKK
ncbi:MAG: hypothetical protein Q4D27_06645 [Coriobacteriia bacterium]|nr:hypothetical protein [Coriobacteriia bacterium]